MEKKEAEKICFGGFHSFIEFIQCLVIQAGMWMHLGLSAFPLT